MAFVDPDVVDDGCCCFLPVGFERDRSDPVEGAPAEEKGWVVPPCGRELTGGNGPTIAWFKDPDGNILSVLVAP